VNSTHSMSPPPAARWRVPFVRPDLPSFVEVEPAFRKIFAGGSLTKGEELAQLEAAACARLGAIEVVGVSSCTVGLALGLKALVHMQGDQQRDEVIVPSFTFLAGPAAVEWAGLRPVFVDCDPAAWTVSPASVAAAISPRTAAILACHTFGCPCDLDELTSIADEAGIPLMIDAAHGLGSRFRGRQVGSEGFAQVFSLSPTKLVVAGEGGLVATSSPEFAALLRRLREYGNDGDYSCSLSGLNGRLPELSAALGHASLARLPEVLRSRASAAAAYLNVLDGVPGIGVQQIAANASSSWKDFSITINPDEFGTSRDAVREILAAQGIDTRAYYSPACHRMPAFIRYHSADRHLPATDHLAARSLSLPMGAHVSPAVAEMVARALLDARG
jgi:dTDP-4-amino-4,6-dideoxygalactose transaminase